VQAGTPAAAGDADVGELLPARKTPVPAWSVAALAVVAIGAFLVLGTRGDKPSEPVLAAAPAPAPAPEPAPPAPAPAVAKPSVPPSAPVEPPKPPVPSVPEPMPAPAPVAVAVKPAEVRPATPSPTEPAPLARPAAAPLAEPKPAVAASPERARELLEEADLSFEEEDFARAVARYRAAIQADATLAKAYKGLFRAGMASGDLKSAKAGAQGYLKLSPGAPDAAAVRAQLQQLP
jgi:outer membrane biosynthesis protein TonB